MIQAPNFAHILCSPYRNIFSAGQFSRWWPKYKKTVSDRRNSQSTFYICAYCIYTNANYISNALNVLFSYICFTIFYYLTKTDVHNRWRYEKTELFCTTRAHWYASLPIIWTSGSVSGFVQSDPKYAMTFNSTKSYLNLQDVPKRDSRAAEMGVVVPVDSVYITLELNDTGWTIDCT